MITITDSAASKIRELTPAEMQEKYALRMRVVGGGCSGLQYQMGLEEEQNPNDKVFVSNGVKVFIDMKSALYLAGAEVDVVFPGEHLDFRVDLPALLGDDGDALRPVPHPIAQISLALPTRAEKVAVEEALGEQHVPANLGGGPGTPFGFTYTEA